MNDDSMSELSAVLRGAQVGGPRKLLNAGWDRPGPAFLRHNSERMAEAPFDGVVFNLWEVKPDHRHGNVWQLFEHEDKPGFRLADVDPADFEPIRWSPLTDNFLAAKPCAWHQTGLDLFSDDEWAAACQRIRLLGEVLRASGARGIWFDMETAGHGWAHDPRLGSFDEVAAQARRRGADFMTALQAEKSDVVVLFTYLVATRYEIERLEHPETSRSAMLPHFAAGMIEAKSPQAQIIDGSDTDYLNHSTRQFAHSRQLAEHTWSAFCQDHAVSGADQLGFGGAAYADAVSGVNSTFAEQQLGFYQRVSQDRSFTENWLRHNVYHALMKADEFAWLWNEKMSWWNPQARPLPPGADRAVKQARALVNAEASLGYDMCRRPGGVPAFVAGDDIRLELVDRSPSPVGTGETITLRAVPSGSVDIDQLVVQHNSSVVLQTELLTARMVFRVGPGAHTFQMVSTRVDGTHQTSNPVIITTP